MSRRDEPVINIRVARELDVEGIRDVFLAAYGEHYAYPEFYDLQVLKKMVFDDSTLLLVAEDEVSRRVLGTASIIFDIGAYGDLVGEFGRLVVHPDGRQRGIGKSLMEARLEHVKGRLHVAVVENRVAHPYSQRISAKYGFTAVGFLPNKLLFDQRESVALYFQHFDEAIRLRRNNPRIVPEAYPLAHAVLTGCDIDVDVIVDDHSPAYPNETYFERDEFRADGYAPLLRFERGRTAHREIFGPARIYQGLFKLQASHSHYLVAREEGRIAGAIGFTVDESEKTATVFEIVTSDESPVVFLLKAFVEHCWDSLRLCYLEIDVSAYAPRMQRTLLEQGFIPAGYLPAFAFSRVERCDAIRMARLPPSANYESEESILADPTKPIAALVCRHLESRTITPRLALQIPRIRLFQGLTNEQTHRLASLCTVQRFHKGTTIFSPDQDDGCGYLILDGSVEIRMKESPVTVGTVGEGECLSENTLLFGYRHAAVAVVAEDVETAVLNHDEVAALVRRRPDIGVVLYRNLAAGLTEKLRSVDEEVSNTCNNPGNE